jgi:hypothetical protein
VRRASNLKIRGGGLHHVAIEASDFDRSLRFYTEGLGIRNVLTFPEEGQTVAMLDTGDATYVELFSGGSGEKLSGSILHLALRTGTATRPLSRRALQAAPSPKSLPTWCSKATRPYPCATPSAKGRTASKSSCSKPKRSDGRPHLKKARRSHNAPS